MVTIKGRIVADFFVVGLEEALLLVLQPELTGKVQSVLERFVIASDVQIQDGSSQWGILSVHGPSVPVLLERVLGAKVKPKEAYSIEVHRLDQNPIWVIHQQELGTFGFDLLIPSEGVGSLWSVLISEGATLGVSPFGWQTYDILRIEAGFPRYGYELDETVFPLEAEVEDALSYDKGCYLGQETVNRMKFRGHANRLRIGFEAKGEVLPKKGDPLRCEGKETGWVTSAAFSPLFRKVIGMGYVRRDYSAPGTRLVIQMESGETDATVCALPFVGLGKKSLQ